MICAVFRGESEGGTLATNSELFNSTFKPEYTVVVESEFTVLRVFMCQPQTTRGPMMSFICVFRMECTEESERTH